MFDCVENMPLHSSVAHSFKTKMALYLLCETPHPCENFYKS